MLHWLPFWLIGAFYIFVLLWIYLQQDKFIFEPVLLKKKHPFTFRYPFQEVWLEPDSSTRLHGLLFQRPTPSSKCVLYHHGNARNLADWASRYDFFISNGYDVLFYDYPSYGKSRGKLSQDILEQQALLWFDWLSNKYSPENIVSYGCSLGTYLATYTASKRPTPLLILETPYLSLLEMAKHTFKIIPVHWLLKFTFRTDLLIPSISCPIVIFHGTKDEQIPYKQAQKLTALNPNTTFITIPNGKHSNLSQFDEYHDYLRVALGRI